MGLNYRKRFKILPGVTLNVGKTGVTTTIGGKGARVTLGGQRGTRTTVGIPGTGLSYSQTSKRSTRQTPADKAAGRGGASGLFIVLVVFFVAVVVFMFASTWLIKT